ncbi:MAG: ABC transporter substrate-binding protein [Pseudomonadota bacterium]
MKNHLKSIALLFFLAVTIVFSVPFAHAVDRVNMVFIGDRVVDAAYHLGVVSDLVVVECDNPNLEKLRSLQVRKLSCPGKFSLKRDAMVEAILKQGVTRVICDKEPKSCSTGPKISQDQPFVPEHKDLKVEYIDFSEGLEPAIRNLAKSLNKEAEGEKLIERYNQEAAVVEKNIPKEKIGKKVLVLNGVYQPATGKTFVQMESKGGYGEMFFLDRLGCENVTSTLGIAQTGNKPYVTVRNLKSLKGTQVDLIVSTGDTYAVQKFLYDQLKQDPGLAGMPALKNMAVFSLPIYNGGSPLEYPENLNRWLAALTN